MATLPDASQARADNLRSAFFMTVSMAAFVVNDSIMKLLSEGLPLFQAVLIRGFFATVLVSVLAIWLGAFRLSALAAKDRKIAALRAGAEVGATVCFLSALFNMPFANAMAILQSAPILLTFIGAAFLGETVGWRRWSAVCVGFCGVLLIVRPGTDGFNAAAIWALIAVVFICVRDLATRRLSRDSHSMFITLITAVAITSLGGLVSATQVWTPVPIAHVGLLALAACFLFVGYFFSVLTMRIGEIAFVSPFRYSILIWALLIGWVMFDEIPDFLTLAGAILVVSAGLYTLFREARLR